MRGSFDEISDDEWENHSFKPSRILKKARTAPTQIESFAYRSQTLAKPSANGAAVVSDDDDGDEEEARASRPPRSSRSRRFVLDEDSEEVIGARSEEEEEDEVHWSELEEEEDEEEEKEKEKEKEMELVEEEEVDVVGKALQKCAKISASLRQELYGSSVRDCERYAETEAASCRIVTQEDIDAACSTEDSDFQPILKPYQLVGVNFLLLLYRKNIGGAILADEMGLGKTIQAVTYLTLLQHLDTDPGPHLIVCPASVLENWERELKKWCPSFSVIMFHGSGRATYSKELSYLGKAGLPPPFNVLLVCYSLFERRSAQQKDDRKVLKRWRWSCVLMDEAHVLKDKNSFRWKNLMSVAQSAQDSNLISRIKSILGPFILRRLKSDVMQQLVPKIQNVKYVFMGSEQAKAYDDAINEYRAASQARNASASTGISNTVIGLFQNARFQIICAVPQAILADEMGLGKTIQAVTYLTLLQHLDTDPGPHLIVCPASVLENWERELKKWCPSFSVIMFHGSGRATYSKELSYLGKAGLPPPFNVLLVCYSLFERRSAQQKDDRKVLKRWRWSCVLMDEAHVLKDKNSFRWKNLMSVAQSARQRLMLTGTPLQNDLHELWSLLEFMMPDIFSTGDVDLKKLLNAEDSNLISRIKSILGPFILRRLKSDVMQQLVPKIQNVKYVFMGSEQAKAYDDAINEYRAASQARNASASTGISNTVIGLLPKRQISNYFVQFRKIANHPLLVRRIYHDEDVIRIARMLYPKGVFGFECMLERAIQELKNYNDFAIHRLLISYGETGTKGALTDEHVLGSAKCQALAELLPLLMKGGHRVLIFSQWTTMLDILEWTLEVVGVTYRRLDGSTQVNERQTIVDTFNNDPSIFACLLSTRAGGQGLNLIGADTVIIHDMDFNPQMDRQAEDRCHRIGQVKPVTVYRLVTKDTVDENIYEIARRKLVLDAAVLESGAELDDDNDVSEKTMGEILASLLLV
ncbi:Protein CHROMATIN REMODELING 19 [Ananas comosus]|uniref:Protein CHROMATIN REMODELING 19 n=1 Tax=Ananas comosus TaxID=4615 RepID=A0A199VMW5_ANACO|nr:Protein CHROMATIN REMODELING 19 [Ananas comosus]